MQSNTHTAIPDKQFSRLIQTLQRDNCDCAKIVNAFADIEDIKRLRQEFDHDRQNLEVTLEEVKDTLLFAEQLLQYGVGISEVLAFMLAVDEKADMESISRGAAAYRVIEEIRAIRHVNPNFHRDQRTGWTTSKNMLHGRIAFFSR